MKKITFLLFLIPFLNVSAQDIIFKKDGNEVRTKVLEIQDNSIKYKVFENLNGPTYTINKQEVIMIKYENGYKDYFYNQAESQKKVEDTVTQKETNVVKTNKNQNELAYININKKYCKSIIPIISQSNNVTAIELFNKGFSQYKAGRTVRTIGIVFSSLGVLELIAYYGASKPNPSARLSGLVFTPVGVACLGVGIPLAIIGKNNIRQGIVTYNKGLKSTSYSHINLKLNYDYSSKAPLVGLQLKF